MKLSKKLIKRINDAGFSVEHEDGNIYCFGKYSPAGQDFSFSIDTETNIDEFAHNIWSYYTDFDCSEEAYLWLDSSGHGRNGAPYDMKDLYEDMEACEKFIEELYDIVCAYRNEVAT